MYRWFDNVYSLSIISDLLEYIMEIKKKKKLKWKVYNFSRWYNYDID